MLDAAPLKLDAAPLKLSTVPLELDDTPLEMDVAPLELDAMPLEHDGVPLELEGMPLEQDAASLGLDMCLGFVQHEFMSCKTHEVLSPLPPEKLSYGRHGCVEIHWNKKRDKCYIKINP